jgi:L-2-hydroxyglutarate oxidase LhgO
VPEPGGLGVHVTLDLGGRARFGPDVEWVDAIDYRVDPRRAQAFYAAIRRYWPGLPAGALEPGYAGIRPKISGRGEPAADFVVQGPREHGVPGLVHLFGIESPGLTASLALAAEVLDRLS